MSILAHNPFNVAGVGSFVTAAPVNYGLSLPDLSAPEKQAVLAARTSLTEKMGLHGIQWLQQIHGHDVLPVDRVSSQPLVCDGMWSDQPGIGLVIQTADCVPVFVADRNAKFVGAAHAGWQGLRPLNGHCILEALVDALPVDNSRLRAWVGPCICAKHYEVGEAVWRRFERDHPEAIGLHPVPEKRYLDLRVVASQQLARLGVAQVQHLQNCTWCDGRLFSHRQTTQEQAPAGRFVSGIYLPKSMG
ncbi:MAG: peptidoglycan editing factor PgeF [Pseudomonadota bacterium]